MLSYVLAREAELRALCATIQRREEEALIYDMRPRPPFIPCPVEIGNDPCDDWSYDEEYD